MVGLPDILEPGLSVVLCGTAVGEQSAARGHYYAGRGNAFWRLLHESGLTPVRLSPADDATLPNYGIGLTDLAKNVAQSHDRGLRYDLPGLVARLEAHEPRWIAFTSLEGARQTARLAGHRARGVEPGPQPWKVGGARAWALPSPSGRNNGTPYEARLAEWSRMAAAVRGTEAAGVSPA